jgi:hypothetical protein
LSATRLIVRAPTELAAGVPTTVRATDGEARSTPAFPIEVSVLPGAPTLREVHRGSCSDFDSTPSTTIIAGQPILVEATGVDTNGAMTAFVWTPLSGDGATTSGSTTCNGPSGRVYTVTVVPEFLSPGSVSLEIRTTTAGGTSAVSNAIQLTIPAP